MSVTGNHEESFDDIPRPERREVDDVTSEYNLRFYLYARLQGLMRFDQLDTVVALSDVESAADTEIERYAVPCSDDDVIPVLHYELLWRPNPYDADDSHNPPKEYKQIAAGIDHVTVGYPKLTAGRLEDTDQRLVRDIYFKIIRDSGESHNYLGNSKGVKAFASRADLTPVISHETDDIIVDGHRVATVDESAPELDEIDVMAILQQGKFRRQAA